MSEPCDLAIWDVRGDSLDAIQRRLIDAARRSGPKLSIVVGEWLGQRVAIGGPRRVTAAQAASVAEGIAALQQGHRPRTTLVVGPVAGGERGGPRVVAATKVVDWRGERPGGSMSIFERLALPRATLCDGVGEVGGVVECYAAAWATSATAAMEQRAVEGALVGLVVAPSDSGRTAPPVVFRATAARRAGRFLGGLLRGELVGNAPQPIVTKQHVAALEAALRRLVEE